MTARELHPGGAIRTTITTITIALCIITAMVMTLPLMDWAQ